MNWKPESRSAAKIVLKIDRQRLSAIDVDPKILRKDNESRNDEATRFTNV